MLYFDNSATTRVADEVLEAMLPYLREEFGNASSKHYAIARNARDAVENARSQIAALLNASPNEIVFTSGASEGNNFIIKGVADSYASKGKHIVTSSVEHKSVLNTVEYLSQRGFEVTYLPVDRYGQVNPLDLEGALRPDTILASIMWGNNEVGTTNDVFTMARICESRGIFFHTDATQVIGKLPVDLQALRATFVTLSAHKFHGPKGVGCCYLRESHLGPRPNLTPLIHGGSQEQGYRGGTLAVHNIVGLGKAAELAGRDLQENSRRLTEGGDWLSTYLVAEVRQIRFNGHPSDRIPGILSITVPELNADLLVQWLAAEDIAVSSGSACSIGEPSHVLKAMGFTKDEIRRTVRVSLDASIRREELACFAEHLVKALM
ncbi:MAG: cysteine desulfurase family protein [Syntrophomonadaceae bacterium]|nr:cysteine desulfurase family protein [Syntrophomonadaceae bacterium]